VNKKFWKNKKVLITGHTGFKGRWLSVMLELFGSKVYGVSLKTNNNKIYYSLIKKNYECDINNFMKLNKLVKKIKPNIIFHLAAQSLVLSGYKKIINTYETNFMGTINIIEISKMNKSIKSLLITTTDKVYKNNNKNIVFHENSELGGKDPYSASKAAVEIAIQSYIKSDLTNHLNLASMRAGNVVGGGDFAPNRLMNDLVKHFQKNKKIKEKLIIRNPNSIRPWQYVLDVLSGYILLAEKLYFNKKFADSFNFGPNINLTRIKVKQVVKEFQKQFKKKDHHIIYSKQKNNNEEEKIFLKTKKVKTILNFKNKINSLQNLIGRSIFVYKKIKNKKSKAIKNIYIDEIRKYIDR
jgi:CDP-glucose 4,6-dehydratase